MGSGLWNTAPNNDISIGENTGWYISMYGSFVLCDDISWKYCSQIQFVLMCLHWTKLHM